MPLLIGNKACADPKKNPQKIKEIIIKNII